MMVMGFLISKKVVLTLLIGIFTFQLLPIQVKLASTTRTSLNQHDSIISIIFDEAHLDPGTSSSLFQFNHENAMQKPLDILSQLDFNGDFEADFNIIINANYLTESYFEEIGPNGILIMTLLDKYVGSSESKTIRTWVENGGSIFIATQPDYAGFRYCKVEETNLLLKKLHVYDMFHLYQFQDQNDIYNSDELYDNIPSHQFSIDGQPTNPWDIVVTDKQFTTNEFGQAMKEGINNVLIGTSSIEVNSSEYVGAYSWKESYSVSDVTGEVRLEDEAIPWLVGTKLGKGRVVLLGSTFPISDWIIYDTTLRFIDQLDNMRLWINIIKWLSQAPNEVLSSSTTTTTSQSSTTTPNLTIIVVAITIASIMKFYQRKKKNLL